MSRRARLWQSAREAKYVPHDLSDVPGDECLHGDGMDPDRDYLLQCPDCGGSW